MKNLDTRTFNGELYKLYEYYTSKDKAIITKKILKKQGYSIRIVNLSGIYYLYRKR